MTNYETLKYNEAISNSFHGQAIEVSNALHDLKKEILSAIRPICEPILNLLVRILK